MSQGSSLILLQLYYLFSLLMGDNKKDNCSFHYAKITPTKLSSNKTFYLLFCG